MEEKNHMIKVYTRSEIKILEQGLEAMSRTCESLTKENQRLEKKVEDLEAGISHLKDRLIIERGERE
jgi:cell division protein FtsB